jgi:hypothetical protein
MAASPRIIPAMGPVKADANDRTVSPVVVNAFYCCSGRLAIVLHGACLTLAPNLQH